MSGPPTARSRPGEEAAPVQTTPAKVSPNRTTDLGLSEVDHAELGLFDVVRTPAPPDQPPRVALVLRDEEDHVRGPGRRTTTGPQDAQAPHWWWTEAERIVLSLVRSGHHVTSDDLHDRFPDEPSATGAAFGGLFNKLAHAGLIAECGWERSRRPQARGRKLTVWGAGERS